jgi:hypothetical protein
MYKLHKNMYGEFSCVELVGKNIFIPFEPDNTDYQAYLKWLEEGNTPEPADE